MPLYSAGIRTAAAPAANAPFAELRAGARPVYVKEIGVFLTAATSTGIGLARPAAVGVTPTTTFPGYQVGVPRDPALAAAVGALASAWTTAPTTPAAAQGWMRRATLAAAIGAGLIWTFPEGIDLAIPANGSIALFNTAAAAGAILDAYAVWEE